MVEPLAFIVETLTKFPTLRASRLYQMVRERGYPGAADHFRTIVSRLRPRPTGEAYLRLRTLPGEQGQVDWAHFGKLTVGRAVRPLMAFVMVLSYSRYLFLRFYLNAAMTVLPGAKRDSVSWSCKDGPQGGGPQQLPARSRRGIRLFQFGAAYPALR